LKVLRCHSGFTLIEIAAVLVIIAILSVLAVKRMGGTGISAYGDADRLVADLRYAQSLAMTRAPDEGGGYNGEVTITTTEDGDGWCLDQDGDGSCSDNDEKDHEDKLWFADGAREDWELQDGTTITQDVSITFKYPKGKVVNAASDPTTITLQRGDNSIIINVYSETGYVEIQ
jgi:prepilin-type N-terminal cleavage/methylation domain-containing protein